MFLEYLKNNGLIKGANSNCGIVFFNKKNNLDDIKIINSDFDLDIDSVVGKFNHSMIKFGLQIK